ncbi:hypothetical protein B0H16DRAFT_1690304 [Mycena metata]|uniref:Uncharacterized protein n=1 Tax=Mycena metata TaxID=1033252 RepID=A0AAD7ND09_9AGAR|nr:hypothetical protein B0H16DRAFT_1690304 [Mycena metata]
MYPICMHCNFTCRRTAAVGWNALQGEGGQEYDSRRTSGGRVPPYVLLLGAKSWVIDLGSILMPSCGGIYRGELCLHNFATFSLFRAPRAGRYPASLSSRTKSPSRGPKE